MRRSLWTLVLLAACEDPDPTPVGEWDLTLTCDEGAAADAVPSCAGGGGGILALRAGAEGEHRTFFPGFPRDGGGYTGTPGPATWGLVDGEVAIELVGDLDDPFLSVAERDAWATHRMTLAGRFESVCWAGRFAWTDPDGVAQVTGDVELVRAGLDCR